VIDSKYFLNNSLVVGSLAWLSWLQLALQDRNVKNLASVKLESLGNFWLKSQDLQQLEPASRQIPGTKMVRKISWWAMMFVVVSL
jgi:hypothetical protein